MQAVECFHYEAVIESICGLAWEDLSPDDVLSVAIVYYYFSIQFRENLQIARALHPDDAQLLELEKGECGTDNLSPWPGVALAGERMHHDEFMRRSLALSPARGDRHLASHAIGRSYLASMRQLERKTRASSIASYEDGGLERVFGAILTCAHWDGAVEQAFQHFLRAHILFDSDPEQGHGALARHLRPDDDILPCWEAFKDALVAAVPALAA